MARLCEKYAAQTGIACLSIEEHRESPTPASRTFKLLQSLPKDGSAESAESPDPERPLE